MIIESINTIRIIDEIIYIMRGGVLMEIRLIKANIFDGEKLCAIQAKAFQMLLVKYLDYDTNPSLEKLETMTNRLNMPNRDVYFIKLSDIDIGSIIIAHNGTECTLIRIGILPEFQNKGYAQQAIKLVEALYENAKTWKLDTIKQEEKLCYFYEKLGYKKTGKEKNIKDGMDLVYYVKCE